MYFTTTDIDSLVWYNKLEDMTIDDIRQRILRTSPTNEKMKIGTAWHLILESPPEEINTIERDGIIFRVDCEKTIILPQIREIRANKIYYINSEEINISGQCDGISGNKITDHKLTFNPNIETYFDSYQWKSYLDIFNADIFEYILYLAKEEKGVVVIKDVITFCVYRYPNMQEDLIKGIGDLVNFAKKYIPEKCNGQKK
jgi:hypothetical protein